jgi:hypothetical protein
VVVLVLLHLPHSAVGPDLLLVVGAPAGDWSAGGGAFWYLGAGGTALLGMFMLTGKPSGQAAQCFEKAHVLQACPLPMRRTQRAD